MMTAAARERRRVCGGGYRGTIGAREERKVREKIQRGKRVCAISGKEALKVSDGMGEEEERERRGKRRFGGEFAGRDGGGSINGGDGYGK